METLEVCECTTIHVKRQIVFSICKYCKERINAAESTQSISKLSLKG